MNQKPLITTVIPTYRRPILLRRAIKSILNQTYSNFEILVCDNASGDETAKVVTELSQKDKRIKYHCHKKNIGAIPNFNYGIQYVKTPYFSLLSDDSTLLPDFFENALDILNKSKDVMFFAGNTLMVTDTGKIVGHSLQNWNEGMVKNPDGLLHIMYNGIPNWEGVLFRGDVIREIGILNPEFNATVDQDFMMRIARHHPFFVCKKPCATFLIHEEQWSANRNLQSVISTLETRMELWINDEKLSATIKEKIKIAMKIRFEIAIRRFILFDSIIGDDAKTLNIASNIIKNNPDLSNRAKRIVFLARMITAKPYIKKTVSNLVSWYIRTKHKLIFLKDIKNRAYKKYIPIKNEQEEKPELQFGQKVG